MARARGAAEGGDSIVILAPSLRRARRAVRALGGLWEGKRLIEGSYRTVLERSRITAILLCPEGLKLDSDLEYLRETKERFLWPAPDPDVRAAIAGLRGEDLPPLGRVPPVPAGSDRKSALLLEGVVTPQRVRAALGSARRHWIVENPLRVQLSRRQLQGLEQKGVRWSVLDPVQLLGVLVSPALSRVSERWRHLLPPRVKVKVLRP